MDTCLRKLEERNKSRFDSYSVRNSVLNISHITFRDYYVHIFFDNLSRNSCIQILFLNWRRLCRPSVIYGILARVGGDLNDNFRKSQMPWGLPGGMLKLRFDRYIRRYVNAHVCQFSSEKKELL